LSLEDNQNGENRFRRSPTGPSVAPPRKLTGQLRPSPPPSPWSRAPQPPQAARSKWPLGSLVIFLLLVSSVVIQAYLEMSQPGGWDYWKDQYVSPSLTSSVIPRLDLDSAAQGRRTLSIKGEIGPAAAKWFRDRLNEAHLAAGDVILMSSPGGDLNQAEIMGEIIRSRGLVTAVGVADAAGNVKTVFLRQRLRARLCRRQDPLRRAGLGAWRAPVQPRQRRSLIPSPKPRGYQARCWAI